MATKKKQVKHRKSFLESRGFKKFMGKLYGFGASVVIIGALFKIQHYPGSEYLLPAGLGMEAIIFFFQGLQKPHVEPDWSYIYPEFIDLYHSPKEVEKLKARGKLPEHEKTPAGGGTGSGGGAIDALMQKADISQEEIDRFGKGLERFTKQTEKLSDISDATVATEEYVQNIKKASESAGKMNESLEQASETVSNEFNNAGEYSQNVKKASDAAANLAEVYQNNTQEIKKENEAYSEVVSKIKDNLNALNSVYELQLQDSNKQKESSQKMTQNVESFLSNLEATNKATENYQKQVNILTEKVSALNNVYGNMLSAMNVGNNNK